MFLFCSVIWFISTESDLLTLMVTFPLVILRMLKPTVGIMSSLNWPDCRHTDRQHLNPLITEQTSLQLHSRYWCDILPLNAWIYAPTTFLSECVCVCVVAVEYINTVQTDHMTGQNARCWLAEKQGQLINSCFWLTAGSPQQSDTLRQIWWYKVSDLMRVFMIHW